MIYGCVCESSWPVGLGAGETQEPEWFGPDCSLKHCPSADNPRTNAVETNCYGMVAKGSIYAGAVGNLCQVDCANQVSRRVYSCHQQNTHPSTLHIAWVLPLPFFKFKAKIISYVFSIVMQGICDHSTGTCQCFDGQFGVDCSINDPNAVYEYWVTPNK
jgi:hypothetical protein